MSRFWFNAHDFHPAIQRLGRFVPHLPLAAQRGLAAHPTGRRALSKNCVTAIAPEVWQSMWAPRPDAQLACYLAGRPLGDDQLDWLVVHERRLQPLLAALRYNASNEAWVRRSIDGPGGPRLANAVDVAGVADAAGWCADDALRARWARRSNGDRRLHWVLDRPDEVSDAEAVALLCDPGLRVNPSVQSLITAAQLVWSRPAAVAGLASSPVLTVALAVAGSHLLCDAQAQAHLAAHPSAEVRYELAKNPSAGRDALEAIAAGERGIPATIAKSRLSGAVHLPPGTDPAVVSGDVADEIIRWSGVPSGSWRGVWVPSQLYALAPLATNPNLTEAQVADVASRLNGTRPENILGAGLRNELRLNLAATYPGSRAAKFAARAARAPRRQRAVWDYRFWIPSVVVAPPISPQAPAGPVHAEALELIRVYSPDWVVRHPGDSRVPEVERTYANLAWLVSQPATPAQWSAVLALLEDTSSDDDLVAIFAAGCSVSA